MKTQIKKVISKASNPNIIEIDGEKYIYDTCTEKRIDGVPHGDKIIFKKFNEEEYVKNLEIIINAIKDQVTKEHLLSELLKTIDAKTLRRLVKRIKAGKPIKRQDGCLGFKIGDSYVSIID